MGFTHRFKIVLNVKKSPVQISCFIVTFHLIITYTYAYTHGMCLANKVFFFSYTSDEGNLGSTKQQQQHHVRRHLWCCLHCTMYYLLWVVQTMLDLSSSIVAWKDRRTDRKLPFRLLQYTLRCAVYI